MEANKPSYGLRIMRVEDALGMMKVLKDCSASLEKTSPNSPRYDTSRYNYLSVDELLNIPGITNPAFKPNDFFKPGRKILAGEFLVARMPKEGVLEVGGSLRSGAAREAYFPTVGLDFLSQYTTSVEKIVHSKKIRESVISMFSLNRSEPVRIPLVNAFLSAEYNKLFIKNTCGFESYVSRPNVSNEMAVTRFPISKNWIPVGTVLTPDYTYGFEITPLHQDQLIVQGSCAEKEPLEITLLKQSGCMSDLGNGVVVLGKEKMPLYLKRVLGLSDQCGVE